MSFSAHITPASSASMDRAMRGQILVLGREPHKAVDKAYRSFAASAGLRSPGGKMGGGRPKANRDVIPNPKYMEIMEERKKYRSSRTMPGKDPEKDPVIRGAAKWLIRVRHQTKPDTFIPTNKHKGIGDKRRKIATRYLMRKSWRAAVAVGLGGASTGSLPGRVSRHSIMQGKRRLHKGAKDPYVQLTHRLEYQMKIRPDIADQAMQAAARSMQYQVDKKILGKMGAEWEGP